MTEVADWVRSDDAWRRAPAADQAGLLVILLHGVGSSAGDLAMLADAWARALPDAAFAALNGTEPFDGGPNGRQWFSLRGLTPENRPARVAQAREPVVPRLAAERARWGVGPDRTVLVGFSQGAILSLRHTAADPTDAACIVAYAGRLTPPVAPGATGAVVTLIHGDQDRVIPASESLAAEAALRAAGRAATAHILPGIGHAISADGARLGLQAITSAMRSSGPAG